MLHQSLLQLTYGAEEDHLAVMSNLVESTLTTGGHNVLTYLKNYVSNRLFLL